jgi:hypothetical protein
VSVRLRRGKPSEWTLFRQLAGNIVPFIHWLPTFILAWLLIEIFGGTAFVVLLVLLGVFSSLTFGTWALFDRFGMFQNATMRRALRPRRNAQLPGFAASERSWFVGLATQGYFSLLDTDEDVGYLTLFADRLTYAGDRLSMAVPRDNVLGVERRAIPGYSLFGYHWAVVRFESPRDGEPTAIRLLSRDVDRLRHQPDATRKLFEALQAWYAETSSAMVLPGGQDAYAAAREEAMREINELIDPPAPQEPEADLHARLRDELLLEGIRPMTQAAPSSSPAPSALAQRVREQIRDGADWAPVRAELGTLLRCLESAEAFQTNYELLLGVYVALRARAGELRLDLDGIPPDERLAGDLDLVAEYQAVFGEAAGEQEAPAGSWQALRRGRRLQALFARRALARGMEAAGA